VTVTRMKMRPPPPASWGDWLALAVALAALGLMLAVSAQVAGIDVP